MRAPYLMAFALLLLDTESASGQTTSPPMISDGVVSKAYAAEQGGFISAVRGLISRLSIDGNLHSVPASTQSNWHSRSLTVGETVPETVQLRPIPMHPTYRYAVMNGYRVIVDATSRTVVYVIQ